jgi:hypothetical protein
MWSDNETTVDLLGFKVHADLLRSVVTNPQLLPITIGVFGDWGGGKTSILKMLERDLDPDNYDEQIEKNKYEKIACLYFNGWLFEGYDDAKSALLSTILSQLEEHKRFGPKIKEKARSLMKSVDLMRLAQFGFSKVALPVGLAYLTGGVSLLPELLNIAKDSIGSGKTKGDKEEAIETGEKPQEFFKADARASVIEDVRSFRNRFSEMLKESDIDSLVILIDDLDRCSSERIIDNLEAIKLFLNVDRTAFVIGADPRIVKNAIASRYKPAEFSEADRLDVKENLITDYLEKLIQVPYHVPRLSPAEVESYMTLLFCSRDLNDVEFKKILRAFEKQRATNRYSVFCYANVKDALGTTTILDNLSQSLLFCSSVAPLITEGLKGNPRQVKRFLNAFTLRRTLAAAANLKNIRDDVLVKLMVLEYARNKQFVKLFEWQTSQDGFPSQIKELEKMICPPEGSIEDDEGARQIDSEWATLSMRKWIAMQPKLSEVDLRDYFWIARDRLQTSLSGLSLIPPSIRLIFEDVISGNKAKSEAGILLVKGLQEDERVIFIDLVKQHGLRNPEKKVVFDKVIALIDADIPGSTEMLCNVLSKCPADALNPAIGMDILTLIKRKPQAQAILDPVLDMLRETDSKIARTLKKRP